MKIIAFDWTTAAFLAGRKTRTRRSWVPEYASRFQVGEICQAWNHSPRVRMKNPKKVGELQIDHPLRYENNLGGMTEGDYEREGFAYLEEQDPRATIWGKPIRKAFEDWMKMDRMYYVIDFHKLDWAPDSKGSGAR